MVELTMLLVIEVSLLRLKSLSKHWHWMDHRNKVTHFTFQVGGTASSPILLAIWVG